MVNNKANGGGTNRLIGAAVIAAAIGLAGGVEAAPIQVYFNDFDAAATFGGGATGGLSGVTTTESVQGYAGLGAVGDTFGGLFLRNQTLGNPASSSVLTLNNLPTHDALDIDFLLAAIDSWDSTNGSPAPDLFQVLVDGNLIAQYTFANASGSVTDTPGADIGGGLVNRGFGGFGDRAFDVDTVAALSSIVHSASTAVIEFRASGAGWQGGSDESWGIDNLSVTANVVTLPPPGGLVPEPGMLGLFGLGIAGLGLVRRRR